MRVDLAWRPVAVEIAEEIRRYFPTHALPIMIYSQQGLFFLDDEQVRRIENADVDWLLKDSSRFSAAAEDVRIRRVVERSKSSKQMPRDVKVAKRRSRLRGIAADVAGPGSGRVGLAFTQGLVQNKQPFMEPAGIEPATSALQRRRSAS